MITHNRINILKVASFLLLAMFQSLSSSTAMAQQVEPTESDLVWLKNSEVKVGLKKSSGGAIAWISSTNSDKNLINAHDRGRLVQQSWYGKDDGSLWAKKPWNWNPVQGGDWQGRSATILHQQHDQVRSIVRTRPVHWATGADIDECEMQQTVTLDEALVHIKYDFSYRGTEQNHPERHQEMPAFFVDAAMDTLILYEGDRPWMDEDVTRRQPDFPNEYARLSEHWAAYVDGSNQGIGLFVPQAEDATFYRYPAKADRLKKDTVNDSWCSYVAPIRTLKVTPNFEYSFDVWISIGSAEEIRGCFKKLAERSSGR